MNKVIFLIFFILISSSVVFAEGAAEEPTNYMDYEGTHKDVWKLEASDPLLIGGYGDNFVYNGKKVVPVEGKATVDVNAKKNTGTMIVEFNGTITPEAGVNYTGNIRIEYTEFDEGSEFWEGGIADFVYIHGDTGQEAPVMPKVKSDLASWGPADVYVNDELVYDNLVGHMMYTEGSRNKEDYAIYNRDKSGYYSPKDPTNGSIAHPDEKELHFVAHTVEPDKGNFPPHTVWIHLNFITVKEM
jgi:hypothetical protein